MFNPEREQQSNQEESPSIDLQRQIDRLTRTGVHLPEIVKLLGAEEYLHNIGTAKNPALQFDVKAFIESRSLEEERVILPSAFVHTRDVILPPDEGEIITGSGTGFEKMEIIPRTARFIKLLSELNLQYSVIEGTNDPKMMRELSYRIFDIPGIKKIAFVNDEEGNATFVINDFNSETESIRNYASLTKDQLRELPTGKMTLVVYPGTLEEWAIAMRAALEDQKKPYEVTTTTAVEKVKEELPKERIEYEKAPEGWMTNFGLATKLGFASRTTQRIADGQREVHPEWFAEYLDKSNHPANHYSPELVEYITKELSTREQAPEGWMTNKGLTKELGFAPLTIQRIADQQRQAHPEWFVKYLDAGNKMVPHYSPELVGYITEELSTREQAPDGWMTNGGLANKLDAGFEAIKRIADRQQKAHSEWFREYLDEGGHPITHYSPELVEYITKELSTREQAPEGWMTNHGLAQKLGIGRGIIKSIVDEQEKKHSDWVKEYLNSSNRLAEHYSPELVDYITREASTREDAPEGWITNGGLANKLDVTSHLVKNIATRQREAHQDWFKEYLDESGNSAIHYSPELVEYITRKISARGEQAPEGWMTNLGLAKRLGVDFQTVKKIADRKKEERPDWIKEYLDISNRPANHYSPEFVEYITRELNSRKSTF